MIFYIPMWMIIGVPILLVGLIWFLVAMIFSFSNDVSELSKELLKYKGLK